MGKILAVLLTLVEIGLDDFLMVASGVCIICCILNSLGIYSINGFEVAFSWELVLAAWMIVIMVRSLK